jgi:hypothetical protein
MKSKLFIFIGLVFSAIGVSLVLNSTPVHAAGETYTWINENTIEASGGAYENLYADGKVTFNRNDDFAVSVEALCTDRTPFVITITPSQSNRNGSLNHTECDLLDPSAYDFDISFQIGQPEKGPALPGSDIDFTELDCSSFVEVPGTGEDFSQQRWRCEAMQACIESGASQADCLNTWVSCVDERSNSFSCRNDMVENGTNIDLGGDNEGEEDATTCAIDGIGWLLCPVLNTTARLADGSYGLVDNFLAVQPLYTTGSNQPIYEAWSVMRNIANVAFAIVFLVIIFSQITSFGISNYGIKRMLPRLIVAAILVNVSYWICAIAVDVTNILGSSMKGLFESVGASMGGSPNFSDVQTGNTWTGVVAGILSLTLIALGALYVTLAALLPLLISALFAILAAFVILAIRQALIILLIIISPLAFVAFLLPNTQSLFGKWRNLFQTLLLMYPIIAIIFGASALASQVITASAGNIENEGLRVVTQIFGAATASIPLVLIFIVPKLAGRLGDVVNNPAKGFVDRSRKKAEDFRDRRQNIAATRRLERAKGVLEGSGGRLGAQGTRRRRMAAWAAGAGTTSKLNAQQRDTSAQKALEEAQRNYVADRAAGDEDYAKSIAGPTGDVNTIQAAALAAQKKAFSESVSDMEALQEALRTGDKVQAIAAQNLLFKSGGSGISKFRDAIESAERSTTGLDSDIASTLKGNIRDQHGQYAKQKGADVVKWANSTGKDLRNTAVGDLSNNDLAQQHAGSIEKSIQKGNVTVEQATEMLRDPRVSSNLDKEQKTILTDLIHAQALTQNANRNQPPNNPPNQPPPASP